MINLPEIYSIQWTYVWENERRDHAFHLSQKSKCSEKRGAGGAHRDAHASAQPGNIVGDKEPARLYEFVHVCQPLVYISAATLSLLLLSRPMAQCHGPFLLTASVWMPMICFINELSFVITTHLVDKWTLAQFCWMVYLLVIKRTLFYVA